MALLSRHPYIEAWGAIYGSLPTMRDGRRVLFLLLLLASVSLSPTMGASFSQADSPTDEDADDNKIFDDLDAELQAQADDYLTDVIVLLNVPPEQVEEEIEELQAELGDFEVRDTYSVIPGFAAQLSKQQITQLVALDITVQAEPDIQVQAFLGTATTWFGVQKARTDFSVDGNADASATTYSKDDVVIAIIDTGIDPNHRDLNNGKIIGWRDFINGRTAPYDDNGHGTHVASIAAGEGEANPTYRGVAPGAALVGVKVLGSGGSGATSGVVSGVNWVVSNRVALGIEVMNLSLGSGGCSSGTNTLSLAVNNAVSNGIVAVVSAGNSGPQTCTIGSPAAAANAITVGSMADVGERGFYLRYSSSRGPTLDGRNKPDIGAPGVSITAAARGTTGSYTTKSGTSMASPFVAGVAALMLDANPSLTPGDIKDKLMATAVDWGPAGTDIDYGAGRLDSYEAVRNTFAPPASGSNIAVPKHTFISDSLPGTGSSDTWTINVVDATYPIAVTMIMSAWTSSSSPDFDLRLFSPSSSQIASSLGATRQETISVSISATGPYSLRVESFAGSGPYFVDISAGSNPPPPATPDFSLSASPAALTVPQGSAGSSTVSMTSLNGFASPVTLSLSGTPPGVTGAFVPNPVTPPSGGSGTATLTLNVGPSTAIGTYTLTVTGASGALTHTTAITLTVPDTTPPTAATLTATAVSPTQINLSWTAATDNVGVTGYAIYRNNALIATVAASASAYSDVTVTASSTYTYQVGARDGAGNEALSNVATATTPAPPPAALSVTVSAPSGTEEGETFRVTATISNLGSAAASSVQVTVTLPPGFSTSDPTTVVLASIAPGSSTTVTWEVRAGAPGSYTLTVSAVDASGSSASGSTSVTVSPD